MAIALTLVLVVCSLALTQQQSRTQRAEIDKIYKDESHCLTAADMRGDKDMPISCFCRDAVADARYVYFTYLLSGKDANLNGVFLSLEAAIPRTCGPGYDAYSAATRQEWKWKGPEVVRTYPSDDVIRRIKPQTRAGKVTGRWVPFMVQLVYRDGQGHVARTENYSSREFIPFTSKP